jgi:hyperosmotically inducible protein
MRFPVIVLTTILTQLFTPAPARADQASEVSARVKAALITARIGNARHIKVQTFNGEADLSGVVSSEDAKSRAVLVAGTVPGVTAVGDFLEVRQPGHADRAIAAKVRSALIDSGVRDAQRIDVQVFNGEVDLGGTVHSFADKETAATVAGVVVGVKGIWNDLEVR